MANATDRRVTFSRRVELVRRSGLRGQPRRAGRRRGAGLLGGPLLGTRLVGPIPGRSTPGAPRDACPGARPPGGRPPGVLLDACPAGRPPGAPRDACPAGRPPGARRGEWPGLAGFGGTPGRGPPGRRWAPAGCRRRSPPLYCCQPPLPPSGLTAPARRRACEHASAGRGRQAPVRAASRACGPPLRSLPPTAAQ
jgi:hypothetical protein